MTSTVCVDASLIVALVIPERYTVQAMNLWESWIQHDFRIVAPTLLDYEVTSAFYRKVWRGLICESDGHAALQLYLALDIEKIDLPELHFLATGLARQFSRPNTYDAHYLALSNHLAVPFWTADEKLYHAVTEQFSLIHWIEE
jgi:predicted nucleic acid-binding protein